MRALGVEELEVLGNVLPRLARTAGDRDSCARWYAHYACGAHPNLTQLDPHPRLRAFAFVSSAPFRADRDPNLRFALIAIQTLVSR